MRKRSFDLAWGAWAGILAVMTAVGSAFAGSQLLLMYPRPVKYVVFKYPSMPRTEASGSSQFNGTIPLLYLSREGVVVGQLSDVVRMLVVLDATDSHECLECCSRYLQVR